MPVSTRRRYTDAFKAEAVRLVSESGRLVAQLARELGIPDNVLYRWVSRQRHARDPARGTRRAGNAQARAHAVAPGAGLFTPCGGILRARVPMRYRAIQEHDRRFPMRLMCRTLAVSPAGYYAWRNRPESRRAGHHRARLSAIRVIHRASRETDGSPSIWDALIKQGHGVGEHRVARLMRQDGIRAKTVKKWRATTQSQHRFPVAANILNRQFTVSEPNCVWAGDLTDV